VSARTRPTPPRARGFEFDYNRNLIHYGDGTIRLSPHEADILRVLLNNRARATPIGTLIQSVYGLKEPDAAATSIRVAIHSLRKKIKPTGMMIRAEPRVGYEIDASQVPELNRRLTDKILIALNLARANKQMEVAMHLQQALTIAERRRQERLAQRPLTQPEETSSEP
jgi:DNA-binding winged helix-turn-helix (wHTH) protein